ncbi:hypothetical protein [Sphingorhabdus sp.]|jgi:hypothetical protein|uniref:hypothetical protein n=1 Tax=Sphingorhabdus sp. TaxID=1902408 RepID=UPI002FD8906D|nr:hypothetical protein [Sphingomonadaceae bacterium]
MISLVAATLLSMAAMKGDAMDNARKAFNNCLIETHNTAVGEKASPSDFIKTSDAACPTERAAYKEILIKSERSYGSSMADAEKFASEEIQMIVDSIVTSFNENVENGAKLTPEK